MSKKALNVQDDSRCKGIQGNTSKSEIKCVCLNDKSIINKKTELNIMVDDIKPHIIGITESWANNDITNAELGLEGYVMFRKDRIGRRGGGVLLYIKDTIPAYEVQLQEEADCNEAIWCNLVLLLLLPIQVQGSVFRRIIALWGSGSLEWVVGSTTITHSSADWWDLLLPLA